ncbi:MAG: ribosomal-protein-alanine N-acetyltransferase [Gemmatimonadales bacterium]|nr:MAG: ribosomal-protein-alanine N-acetyltransferase [Gemmatimonadales bacterium]
MGARLPAPLPAGAGGPGSRERGCEGTKPDECLRVRGALAGSSGAASVSARARAGSERPEGPEGRAAAKHDPRVLAAADTPGEPGPGTETEFATRPATRHDLPAVLATEGNSFSTPWSRRAFEALLGRETVSFLVLEEKGEVAGHGVLWWVGPEAEVANLAVAPAFRGRGGGALLLDALLAAASVRGVGKVFLEVRESNDAARSLYARRGFVPVGRRPQYYRMPPEDAVIMALDLTSDQVSDSDPTPG